MPSIANAAIDRDIQVLGTIWRREILHMLRDRLRLVGSLAQPILFLLIIGNGLAPALGQLGGKSTSRNSFSRA